MGKGVAGQGKLLLWSVVTVLLTASHGSTLSFPRRVVNPSCSSSLWLYVHRDHKDYWGRGAQDGPLDFHTAPASALILSV